MSFKSGVDLITEAKSRITMVSVVDVQRALGGSDAPRILDVREPTETNLGRLPGAIVIPRGTLETRIEGVLGREAQVVVYCASDNRSALAADTMRQMGYSHVAVMRGGWGAWVAAGGPVEG